MKALVTGWFSFENMGVTAGDIFARDVVCEWLVEAAVPYDVAVAPPLSGGIALESAEPSAYSHLVFVCGPFGNGEPIVGLLERFRGCRLVGVDLTMLQPLDEWNPFDLLLERDSSAIARPDLSFASHASRVPVVGLILVHPQREYGERGRHAAVHARIHSMLDGVEAAVVPIDTRLDINQTGLRTAAEVESVIARMDLVVTTRLHGMVLALKNGVPALAIDPIAGGAKITRQAQALNWPHVLAADLENLDEYYAAFRTCLGSEARELAARCAGNALAEIDDARIQFLDAFARSHPANE